MANNGNDDWDESAPADTTDDVRDGAREIRTLRGGVADRHDKEHETLADAPGGDATADEGGGEHKAGSTKTYSEDTVDVPTLRPDGATVLDTDDEGRLWFDKTLSQLYIWDGTEFIEVKAVAAGGDVQASYFDLTVARGSYSGGETLEFVPRRVTIYIDGGTDKGYGGTFLLPVFSTDPEEFNLRLQRSNTNSTVDMQLERSDANGYTLKLKYEHGSEQSDITGVWSIYASGAVA